MRAPRRSPAVLFACALAAAPLAAPRAEPPKVLVSIKPLHSLVAAVMDGVGSPLLLVKSAANPHDYVLKPSEAQALSEARLVVWAGAGVETFLEKPVASLARAARVLRLDREKTLTLLPAREGGAWEKEVDDEHKLAHGRVDGHVWLSPDNAAAIVRAVARELSAVDRANAARYASNRDRTLAALKELDAELRSQLAPVRTRRFVVSHDSIQYLQRHYGLAAVGAISISPERPPSARRLYDIRARIQRENVACVFGEPQLPGALVKTAVEGTAARTGVLDTDGGSGVPEGKEAYFAIMRNLGKALATCLGAPN